MDYSNEAEVKELRVEEETLEEGAVSAEVAIQMAKGALENAHADITNFNYWNSRTW